MPGAPVWRLPGNQRLGFGYLLRRSQPAAASGEGHKMTNFVSSGLLIYSTY